MNDGAAIKGVLNVLTSFIKAFWDGFSFACGLGAVSPSYYLPARFFPLVLHGYGFGPDVVVLTSS